MDNYEPPKPTAGDHLHSLIRAGLGSAPIIGDAAVELFNRLVIPPLEKRQAEWRETVGSALSRLESQGRCRLDDLRGNEVFIDAAVRASIMALRTSQKEKRDALRNAILNAALPHAPEESRQQMFFHLVDILTVWHLRILSLFVDPELWCERNAQPPPGWLDGGMQTFKLLAHWAYPALGSQRDLYSQVIRDLYNQGLFGSTADFDRVSTDVIGSHERTEWGQRFLAFITAPPESNATASG